MFVVLMVCSAMANAHYCDTVSNRNQCWNNMVSVNVGQVHRLVKEINAFPLDSEYRKSFNASQQTWAQRVDHGCRDNSCVANSAWDRVMYLSSIKNQLIKMSKK